ncbi:hypothetical protein K2X05_03965 [bacterium]|nr:hypothetical protein [bacterium]
MWTRADWSRMKSSPQPAEWQFFILFCAFTALLFYICSTWFPPLISVFFVCLFLLSGQVLRKINRWWFLIGCALAWLIQPVFLSAIFIVIFLPFGFFLSLFRKKKYQGHWLPQNRDYRFDKSF